MSQILEKKRPKWLARERRLRFWAGVLVGVLGLAAIEGLGALVTPTAPKQIPTPRSQLNPRPVLPGGFGSIIFLTPSGQGLPGGPGLADLWQLDLGDGRLKQGPAVAIAHYMSGQGPDPFGVPILATPTGVMVLSSGAAPSELEFIPLNTVDLGQAPVEPVGGATAMSVTSGGDIAYVDADAATIGYRTLQVAGTWLANGGTQSPAYHVIGPGIGLQSAFVVNGNLEVAGLRSAQCPPASACPAPVPFVGRVTATGALRLVLRGWVAVSATPDGTGLLVRRPAPLDGVSYEGGWQGHGAGPVLLWKPDRPPASFLPAELGVRRVVAWSEDGRYLALDASLQHRWGLFIVKTGGSLQSIRQQAPVRVSVPPGVIASGIPGAVGPGGPPVPVTGVGAWSQDDRYLFFASGGNLCAWDRVSNKTIRITLPGVANGVAVGDLTWMPQP